MKSLTGLALAALVLLARGASGQSLCINEILFNPPGGDEPNQYIEFRGAPNDTLADGTYFVAVSGDGTNCGVIGNVFDLSGQLLGGNGLLLILQKTNLYAPDLRATVLANTDTGNGFGSGSSSSVGHRGLSGQTDLPHASATFFLVQAPKKPVPGDTIDSDRNGLPDGPVFVGWKVLDSVGVLDTAGAGDFAYGRINFRRNTAPGNGAGAIGTVVSVGFTPTYLGRNGNTTNSSATDWIASDNLGGQAPNWTLGSAGSTSPSSRAGAALNHLGSPNFGSPIPAGVTVLPSRPLNLLEGGASGSYTIALNTVPAGSVTIGFTADPQLEVSVDGGRNYASARTAIFRNTAAQTIQVRAKDDNVVDFSPHPRSVSHALISTADPIRYPLTTPIPSLRTAITDNDALLLTELKVNPPGPNDGGDEFVEIQGSPGALLTNVYFLALDGSGGGDPGKVNLAVNLSGATLGANGLLLISGTNLPSSIPAATHRWIEAQFDSDGGALPNGAASFLLVRSGSTIAKGKDLDAGNNGVLEGLPNTATILDAVGWTAGETNDVVYGGALLSTNTSTPDAAARFPGNTQAISAPAWYYGSLATTNGSSLSFDSSHLSTNFPPGTSLTPGEINNTAPTISRLGAISGVIGDPSNPTVDFTIADAETIPDALIVTVTSTNPIVIPDAGLRLVHDSDGNYELSLEPIGVGYSEIVVTVSDGTMTAHRKLSYAASAMGRTNGIFQIGVSDGSSALAITRDLMLVADDENQILRLYSRTNSGLPIRGFDLNPFLGLTDFYPSGLPREIDLEASTRVGDRLYWLGSHSHSELAESKTNRARLFATDLSGAGTNISLAFVGYYKFLKVDLIEWDSTNGHGRGSNYFGLAASGAVGVNPKEPDGSGFNLEGLAMAPGDTNTAYVAFRAPQVPATNRAQALIVPVTNFATLATLDGGIPGLARFGDPIELNLGCRGVRSIEGDGTNYLIIAGPPGSATGVPPVDFRLFTWSGNPADAPVLTSADLSGLNPEGIVELSPAPWTAATQFQLISDNGVTVYYGDDIEAKHLDVPNFKKFRTDWVALGSPADLEPTIRSVALTPDGLVLTWHAWIQRIYRVQTRADLVSAPWLDLPGDIVATDALATKTITMGPTNQCYYRVLLLPP